MQALYQLSYSPECWSAGVFPAAAPPAYTGCTAFCQIGSLTAAARGPGGRSGRRPAGTVGPVSTLLQTAERTRSQALRAHLLRRPVTLAAALCMVSFAAFWAAQRTADVSMIDLMVYRAEGWAVRDGRDLYAMRATAAELPTTYPPFAALLFLPLTLLDVPGMRALATFGNLGLLLAVIHLTLRLLGRPLRPPRAAATLLIASAAVWCEPVWTTLRYGQINLLLAVLVLWDLTRRSGHRWAGVGIGVAAGIKLTPALFAVFLALCGLVHGCRLLRRTGRAAALWNPWLRQAAVAAAAFTATVALSALVLPHDSRRFWGEAVFQSGRVGRTEITDNQSLSGAVARLLHTGDPGWVWAVVALAAAVLGLCAAVAAALAGERRLPHAPAWGAVACAVTALLISPISWSHHWVWCVPLLLLLGADAQRHGCRRRLGAAAAGGVVFFSYALWWVPRDADAARAPELDQSAPQMLLSAAYPLAGTAFLVLTAVVALRALRRRHTSPGTGTTPAAAPAAQAVAKE
ncbi:glycosyltransferase 87 family protein [Streptomyces albus]|uniref:glycosyltransferase 87 family protein n=1 Tax=Streptomyces sp. PHES57 TaxID=2872626 RepID=UPI001CEC55F5|nr:glycosyltransferase 87 family protein [Streptomyces sp. PHES57]